jgi:hypothetical protein
MWALPLWAAGGARDFGLRSVRAFEIGLEPGNFGQTGYLPFTLELEEKQ